MSKLKHQMAMNINDGDQDETKFKPLNLRADKGQEILN